jgi:uncharacterized protein
MSRVSQFRAALALPLFLAIAISSSRGPAQTPPTNAFPPWPTLAEVKTKWDGTAMTAVQLAAENGDILAQHYLGYCYTAGFRVTSDPKAGISWYERALGQNYLPSGFNLGLLYEGQSPGFHDGARALYYFRYTAERGFANSKVELARCYRDGIGVSPDPVQVLNLLEQAADQGNAGALFELFQTYWDGRGVATDRIKAIQWIKKAADIGNPRGQSVLAYQYEHLVMKPSPPFIPSVPYRPNPDDIYGNIPIDPSPQFPDPGALKREAIRLYALSANQGFAPARYNLAKFYLDGTYVEKDEEHGLELMRKSADQEFPFALSGLAGLYAQGIGEPRDEHDRPFELLCRAVLSANNPERNKYADYTAIIHRCESGFGTDRNLVAAAQWYCRAAMDHVGNIFGTTSFPLADKLGLAPPAKGNAYGTFGIGPQLQPVLAAYLKAAVRQDAQAAIQLGAMCLTGREAPRNPAEAWMWFTLASQYGRTDAAASISQAASRMTAAELEEDWRQFPAFFQELQKVATAASIKAGNPRTP